MTAPTLGEARADARAILQAAVDAADPEPLVEAHLDVGASDGVEVAGEPVDPRRVRLAAVGKAAPAMARALAAPFPDAPGICAAPVEVLAAEAPGPVPEGWRAVAGGHPLPDQGSLAAGEALLEAARGTPAEGTLVVGVSGGGSACAEVPRVPLADLRWVTVELLEAGVGIGDLNAVRRALSDLKGGGLVRACGGDVVGLVLSDVVGDRVGDVASGPTVAAPRDPDRARAILEEAGIWGDAPEALRAEVSGEPGETPAGGARNLVVGGNEAARRGMRTAAEARGYAVRERSERLDGEAREVAGDLVREARGLRSEAGESLAYVAGGEVAVTVRGEGSGGPCQELAAAAARACRGEEMVVGAVDTDGTDGPTGAAGGLVDGRTTSRAETAGRGVEAALAESDAGGLLEEVGGLIRTGPTGTNVNDVAVVLVP